jgi:hypothetical protein
MICNHAKYTMQKHKDQDEVFMIHESEKMFFFFIKNIRLRVKDTLLRFAAKKVNKFAFQC